MKLSLIYLIVLFSQIIFSQQIIKGIIVDKSTQLPIPFVSVGILGKPFGTVCNDEGFFEFTVNNIQKKDSIKFSSIGYQTQAILVFDYFKLTSKKIILFQSATQLDEIVVNSKKIKYKTLGTTKYTTINCTGFSDVGGNWKGSEAAILIKNNKNILIESFGFYVIQNKYKDSLLFRLMFYEKIKNDWVGSTFLKKPIIFKLGIKQGEFILPLKDYNIKTNNDFFISLECLMDEMDITKFCYSSSISTSSYYKVKAFSKWHNKGGTRSGGGGADFNVKVSY